MIHPDLLKILVCPDTRAPLVVAEDDSLLSTDPQSRRSYRVEDDIPILLIDESVVLDEKKYEKALAGARNRPENKAFFKGPQS